jgi:hypothetical protein
MIPCALFLLLLALLCANSSAQTSGAANASASPSGVPAVHILGLDGVKRNHHGTLTAQGSGLKFAGKGTNTSITIASIQDVFTSQDSHQTGGKVLTVAKMGVPYGGGRVLSLFSKEKIDSLTLEYRDANGALHGAIFSMSPGQAEVLKKQLVALGAHASVPPVESQPSEKSDNGGTKQ